MEATINSNKGNTFPVPFKLTQDTHNLLKDIQGKTKRTYNEIFFEMGSQYLEAINKKLKKGGK